MIRLLKRILICISVLLGYIPLYASSSPADSLVDRYVNRLTKAVNSKIKADRNKSEKDYLLVYDDPAQTFYTDYVNNGQYFWFNGNSTLESQVRSLVNTVQAQTGTEHLYVVLASIYNYAAPEDVSDIKWSSVKAQNKYEIADINASESVWKSVIPKIRQKTSLLSTNSVLYIISYFTNINGTYKVSHRCFYHGSSSLVVNGFQINATDYVSKSNDDKTDQNSLRIGFLKQTIQAAANSIAKFNADFKQVNEDFAKLGPDSRGMKFYNDYKDLCPDQLILKKLALLINSMDYDAYVAYLSDKKTGDGYYPDVFRGFYDHLYKFNENFKEITKLLPEITSPSQLVKALDVFSEGELAALKYPQRIRAITILNKLKELNDNSWWQVLNANRWGNWLRSEGSTGKTIVSSEELMIALISTAPDNQQPSLMEDLKGTDKKYKLLKDIFKKMDDEPVGEGNYSKLMGVLAPMVVKNATDKALDDLYTKNRIFTWENGKMKNIIQDETKAASATVTINGQSITLNPQFAFYQYTPKYDEELGTTLQKYGVGKPSWNPYKDDIFQPPPAPAGCTTCADIPTRIIGEDDALDPFDLIAIIPTSEINFGTGFSVEADQITLLPSFFIQWYLKKVDNKEIKHNVNMTLAAVSLATGVGGFVSAATLGARILIVAETFFALTAIAGEEYPGFNNFMKENLGTTGYQIFKAVEFGVNLFAAGRGVASLGKGVINTAKRLSTNFLNLIKNNPSFLAKLRAAYPQRFQQLAAWMKNPDLGAVDLAAIANTATNVAKSASKTFSEVMAKYKIKFQVINETTVARASRLAEEGDAFRDPEALFLDDLDDLDGIGSGGNNGGGTTPGGNGSSGGGGTSGSSGGGTQTATAPKLVVAGRSEKFILNSAESKNLMMELALRQITEASVEGQMAFQQIPEFAPNLLEALKAPTLPAKAASVKVFQNTAGSARAVVITAGEEAHLVYAEGEAQPIVSAFIRARQSPANPDTKKDEDECELCKQQPLICTLAAKATYARKNEALAKLCNLYEPTRLQVCARLDMLPAADLNVFLQDLVVPKPPEATSCNGVDTYLADNAGLLTAAMVEAWTIYKEAGRTCLRVSPVHLQTLASAWTNARLRQAPYSFTRAEFVGIARAGGSARSFAEKYDRTVFDNLQRVCNNLTATFVNMNKLKAKLQQENSGATLEGFNFNMKFLGEYATAMNGGTLQFEDGQPSPGRYIDMTDARNQQRKTFYEFKSVQDVGSDFAEQFTKDLTAAAVIEQIKWVFDRTKMDAATIRSQVLNKLLATEGLAQLNTLTAAKKTLYFSGYDPLVGITDDDVRAFINANFETIFLVR